MRQTDEESVKSRIGHVRDSFGKPLTPVDPSTLICRVIGSALTVEAHVDQLDAMRGRQFERDHPKPEQPTLFDFALFKKKRKKRT